MRRVNEGDGSAPHRLSWRVQSDSGAHLVDIRIPLVGRDAAIELDGRRIASIRRPTIDRPWSEATANLDGSPITVTLTWDHVAPLTDVFVESRSLRDGRSLEEARQSAPNPVRGYERWFATNIGGIASLCLAPPWVIALVLISTVALLAIAALGLAGTLPALIAGGSILAVGLLLVRSWLIVTARTHAYLMGRPDLGEVARALVLVAVFAGFPILAAGSLLAGGLLLEFVERALR